MRFKITVHLDRIRNHPQIVDGCWLVCDEWLFAVSPQHGTAVWDVAHGERLHHDPACVPTQYHRGAKHFLTILSDRMVRLSTLVGTA